MKKIIFLVAILTICGCTDPDNARRVLEVNNYKPIEVGGYGWFAGGKDDFIVTKFKATAPNGQEVTGAVTEGLFKGATIRLD